MLPAVATVTFLFVDQVGSTEQLRTLGDTATVPVREQLLQILHQAVDANDGSVIDHGGDGLFATFHGAAEALSAATAMQQHADRHSRARPDEPLLLRVGVHTGEPEVDGSGFYVGMAVVIAARLCVEAAPREVLTTELVRLLVGERFALTPAGDRELKGVGDPVRAYAVTWEPAAVAALPGGLTMNADVPFVGREAEIETLAAAWSEVKLGRPHTLLISGDPGIGKTRLAAEIASMAAAEGAVVLFGRCDEHAALPFEPFADALRTFIERPPPGRDLLELMGPLAAELGRLVPAVSELTGEIELLRSDSDSERAQLFDAVAGWLTAATIAGPVVFVVDDLHWATEPTILLTRHLARSLATSVLFVVTYRDTDLDRTHPLAALLPDLRRFGGVERLSLRGLGVEAINALVENADVDIAQLVHSETDGNAFFVGEVLRDLAERGLAQREGDRWLVKGELQSLPLPEGVREVVGQRLSRLSDAANRVLQVASVVGSEFVLDVVADASGEEPDAVDAALDEAAAAHLVVPTTSRPLRYRFAHALVRETLYREIGPARRLRLHARVGTALERLAPSNTEALAHHWLSASHEHLDRAVGYAQAAGDRAMAALSREVAVEFYQRALDALDPDDPAHRALRLPLLLRVGEAFGFLGRHAEGSNALLEAGRHARDLGDIDALADAAILAAGWFPGAAVVSDPLPLVHDALRALPATDSPRRARLIAIRSTRTSDAPAALALAHEALAMVERTGDTVAGGFVAHSVHFTMQAAGPAHIEDSLAFAVKARAASVASGELELIGNSAYGFLFPALYLGRVDIVREQIAWLREFGTRHRASYQGATAELIEGALCLAEGRFDDVSVCIDRALSWSPKHPNIFAGIGGLTFQIARARGTLADLEPLLADMRATAAGAGGPLLEAHWVLLQAELDRPPASAGVLDLLAVPGIENHSGALGLLAEAVLALGDREQAARLLPMVAAWSGMFHCGSLVIFAPADVLAAELAILAGKPGVEFHLEAATALLDRVDLNLDRYRNRVTRASERLRGFDQQEPEQ
jgi:class 3 adenylate cyclase